MKRPVNKGMFDKEMEHPDTVEYVEALEKYCDGLEKQTQESDCISHVRISAMKKEVDLLNDIIASDVKSSFENPYAWTADLNRMKGKIEILDLLLLGES